MKTLQLFRVGLAGIVGLSFATMARAGELQPAQANVTSLGDATVVTYYTAGADGFDLVATAQADEDGSGVPLRFMATLMPGQRVVISVPQAEGQPPVAVEFARIGDRLEVTRSPTKVALHQ
jgi:hypothetical protein